MSVVWRGTHNVDVYNGTPGDDLIFGFRGADRLRGGRGDDTIKGGKGDDTLGGGEGDDVVAGQVGNDVVEGGLGSDRLWGGSGDDKLYGGKQGDVYAGQYNSSLNEPDYLRGGPGDDLLVPYELAVLRGGPGADTFKFTNRNNNGLKIVIEDFNRNEGDKIDLSSFVGDDLSRGDIATAVQQRLDNAVDSWGDGESTFRLGARLGEQSLGSAGTIEFQGVDLSTLTLEDFII